MHKKFKGLQFIFIVIVYSTLSCTHVISTHPDNDAQHINKQKHLKLTPINHRESLKALIYIQRRLAEQQVVHLPSSLTADELALARSYCELASYGVVHFENRPTLCTALPSKLHSYCSNTFLNCLTSCNTRSSTCTNCEKQLTECFHAIENNKKSVMPSQHRPDLQGIVPKG